MSFSISGGALTARLRAMTFRSILRQEMGWFDLEENSSAALSTKLASDVPLVQGVRAPPPVATPTYFPPLLGHWCPTWSVSRGILWTDIGCGHRTVLLMATGSGHTRDHPSYPAVPLPAPAVTDGPCQQRP